jgi:SAM-dependent methyltransferase
MQQESRRPRDRSRWEQRYADGDLPWDIGVPDSHLQQIVERYEIQPDRALEIGCGTGTNTIWLTQRGFEMTALDLTENAISKAKAKITSAGVDAQLLVRDFLVDEIPGAPYSFVYDRGVFHVFDEAEHQARFATRVAELLARGGIWHSLIGSTDGPPRDSGPPRHSAREVVAAVEPCFEILELSSTVFDGERQPRPRGWVLVARRREA